MKLPASHARTRFARLIGWLLVHFCSSVTLALVERTIIEEVISRAHHAREGRPSPAQWIPRTITRWRIRRATDRLWRTVEGFRFLK